MYTLAIIDNITPDDIIIVANNRQVIALTAQFSKERDACFLPTISTAENALLSWWNQPHISHSERMFVAQRWLHRRGIQTNATATERLLKEYTYFRGYLLTVDMLSIESEQHQVFTDFIKYYQAYKSKKGCKDIFDIYNSYISGEYTPPHARYFYYGFKSCTPLNNALFDYLEAQELSSTPLDNHIHNTTYQSDSSELRAVCQQAYQAYQKNPNMSLAIVHPELEHYYSELTHELTSIFHEHHLQTKDKSFNISLGRPLISYPLCAQVWNLLHVCEGLLQDEVHLESLLPLVQSNYTALNSSYIQGADATMVLSWQECLGAQRTPTSTHPPSHEELLYTLLEPLYAHIHSDLNEHTQCSVDEWFRRIIQWSTHLELLTNTHLSSDEYQIYEKLKSELLSLERIHSDKISLSTLLADITLLLHTTIFSPQSGKNQLQVMGTLEAEGLYFDTVWVLGLMSTVLPPSTQHLHYISHTTALEHHLPRSHFSDNLVNSQQSIALYQSMADVVYLSSPTMVGEEERIPTLLIDWQHTHSENHTHIAPDVQPKAELKQSWETTPLAMRAPPYTHHTLPKIVATLKAQRLCPFSAFAKRLNIPEDVPSFVGVSPMHRGTLVHSALEKFYTLVPGSMELGSLDKHSLEQYILESIDYAFLKLESHLDKAEQPEVFHRLERERMQTLLHRCIAAEQKRPNFIVQEVEKTLKITIENISTTLRIDRIDTDEYGNQIIYDYKTATVSVKGAAVELTEPQLALYAIAHEHQTIGFIALLANGEVSYQYVGDASMEYLPKPRHFATYSEQYEYWNVQIKETLAEFTDGQAKVTPSPQACRYCELESLCRKYEEGA